MARSGKGGAKRGQLRIIGGRWRGRKLSFTPAEGLRPTTDRVRETLFNWLAPSIQGARCADLFAGSGALGLEALSRGAGHCDFVDTNRSALRQIEENLQQVDASGQGSCFFMPALQYLQNFDKHCDIVFIDPPFGGHLAAPVCQLLGEKQLLADGALIYIETTARESIAGIPTGWTLHRDKVAGGVSYRLFIVGAQSAR